MNDRQIAVMAVFLVAAVLCVAFVKRFCGPHTEPLRPKPHLHNIGLDEIEAGGSPYRGPAVRH